MKQVVIDTEKYNKFSDTEKKIFEAYSKSLIIMFGDASMDEGEYLKEIVEVIEKMAFVFLEILPDEIKKPKEFFAPKSVLTTIEMMKASASASANGTTTK